MVLDTPSSHNRDGATRYHLDGADTADSLGRAADGAKVGKRRAPSSERYSALGEGLNPHLGPFPIEHGEKCSIKR
jgi:hypothetical protein